MTRKKTLAWVVLLVSGGITLATVGGPLGWVNGLCLAVIALLVAAFVLSERGHIAGAPKAETTGDRVVLAQGLEAQFAHLLLKTAGIPSSLEKSGGFSTYPNWTNPGEFGDLLVVPERFAAQGRELLESQAKR